MEFVGKIFMRALAVILAAWLLPGVEVTGFLTAVLVALILAVLDHFIKPFLVVITLPVTVFTLGLFLFVINALIILLADAVVEDFMVDGFWWALLYSLVLSILMSIFERIGG